MGSAEVFFRKSPADREIINDYNSPFAYKPHIDSLFTAHARKDAKKTLQNILTSKLGSGIL